ncbi:MAG: AraC family transcriptional regulator [Spirochaetes bacterium]|nr:AraC family transcriptional regulator [Spirochaetota bacterium]
MNINFTEMIIFFSGMLYLLNAVIYLFERNKTAPHFIVIGLLFTVGIWQLYHGCMVSGLLMQYPHLAIVHVPFLYLTAPFLYFFLKILWGYNFAFTRKSALHLLPCVVLTVMLLPFYLKTPDEKRELIMNPFGHSLEYPFYSVIIFLVVMSIGVYAVASISRSLPLFRKKGLAIKKMTLYSLIVIATNYFLIFFYIFGFTMVKVFGYSRDFYFFVIKTLSLMLGFQICLLMIIKIRYPDYYSRISEEGQRIRYASSRIEGLNVRDVLDRLTQLMEVDKIFCDEDLTLVGLAREIDISHYQLSQILNERLSKNFNSFINEYRIREAEKLLVEEPGRSVTSISYAVGFNTISSFYNSFSKMHNMSPAAFRKIATRDKK